VFPRSLFPARLFAPRYWPQSRGVAPTVQHPAHVVAAKWAPSGAIGATWQPRTVIGAKWEP
jgi:hypothetical protein